MNDLRNGKREYLLRILSVATFIIFFQIYMVAPLLPGLSVFFHVSEQRTGLIVPAFLIPYGIATLFYGLLADRTGTKKIILVSFFLFALLTAGTALSHSIPQLILWRALAGIGASGVIPISLAWIGQTYPYEQRGRPLGFIFGAVAGGGAFGSFAGVFLESFIGWKMLFFSVGLLAFFVWVVIYLAYQKMGAIPVRRKGVTIAGVLNGYKALLINKRGRNAYIYVLLNGIFISGVYTWLGLYFQRIFSLNGREIGIALLGYGIPGFLFGPFIGRLADRFGRSRLLPSGLAIGALSSFALLLPISLTAAKIAVITLSIGFDLTQPLLAGIITQAGKERTGQAMSVMAFMLFTGFGSGSYLFGLALRLSLINALVIFSIFQLILAIIALPVFRKEKFLLSAKRKISRVK
jgi:predicted MFS family arabinose efflux permease